MSFGINPSVQDVARELAGETDRMAGCFVRELTEDECRNHLGADLLYLDDEVELQDCVRRWCSSSLGGASEHAHRSRRAEDRREAAILRRAQSVGSLGKLLNDFAERVTVRESAKRLGVDRGQIGYARRALSLVRLGRPSKFGILGEKMTSGLVRGA